MCMPEWTKGGGEPSVTEILVFRGAVVTFGLDLLFINVIAP